MKFRWGVVLLLAVLTAGCATTKSQGTVQELQVRVGELERELQMKDEQIGSLEGQVRDMSYEMERAKSRPQSSRYEEMAKISASSSSRGQDDDAIIRVNATPQQVQTALQNAGYYKGTIDGKVGSGTKSAIAQFQKDHGLHPDGLVGRKTWSELQPFLER